MKTIFSNANTSFTPPVGSSHNSWAKFLVLALTLFCFITTKADPIKMTFVYTQKGYNESTTTLYYCNGNKADKDKCIANSDFNWNQTADDVKNRENGGEYDGWVAINNTSHACSRSSVHLAAGTYTFSMPTKAKDNNTYALPTISIGEKDYAKSSEAYSSGEEKTLEYSINIKSEGDYDIGIDFPASWGKLYYDSLIITQNDPEYSVSVTASNGTVSGTGSTFKENDQVTLTATPNTGYLFNGWTSVTGVTITGHENDNPLTFAMPDNNVSMTANFVACTGEAVTVNCNDNNYGAATGAGSYCAGVRVDLEATPEDGYRFVNWTVTNGTASIDNTNAASTYFTMSNPAAPVTVQANFELNPCTNTKIIQCETDSIIPTGGTSKPSNLKIITSDHHYSGYNGTGYCDFKGSEGELYYVFTAPDGTYDFEVFLTNVDNTYMNIYTTNSSEKYDETTIIYKGTTYYKKSYHSLSGPSGDQAIGSVHVSGQALNGTYIIGLYGKSWTVYDQIVITASTNVFCPYDITMQKSGDEGASAPGATVSDAAVTKAMGGTVVTVTADAPSDAAHYFSGWTADPSVTFTVTSELSAYFTMPDADVTITANYGAVVNSTFSYGVNGDGEITSCENDESEPVASGTSVTSGTSLTLTAAAHTNYIFTGWSATGVDITGHVTDNPITISMPANAATLTANFATINNVIITGDVANTTGFDNNGSGTLEITSVYDFAFNHTVLKFAYSDMEDKYKGLKIAKNTTYNSTNSDNATGFGFYYKTEKADDNIAFCFDTRSGQVKWELEATNNVWKYYYFDHSYADQWNENNLIIYMNGDDGNAHTTYKNGGAFYISEIAATTVTTRPDIDEYTYTRDVTSGNYGTLCLPMGGTIDNATLYTIAGTQTEAGTDYIVLEEQGTTITAGTPYIFQSSASTITATMPAATEVPAGAGALVGSYVEATIPTYDGSTNFTYFLGNNQLYQAKDGVKVRPYGAYIDMYAIGTYTPAPGRRYVRMVVNETDQAQGLTEPQALPAVGKVLENGVLYIVRDGRRYTILGQ